MPERHTSPDERSGPDYIQLDALADHLGEDPGRYLDGNLDPLPRIRGLASGQAIRAFRAAERKIARIRGREPRQRIMEVLDRREAFLENFENGRRDLSAIPEKEVLYRTSDGELVPYDAVDLSGALEGLGQSVATDGGEDADE